MSTNLSPILPQPTLKQQNRAASIRRQIHRMRRKFGACLNVWPVKQRRRYEVLAVELKRLESEIFNGDLNNED